MDSQGHGYVWADEVNQEAQEQEPDNFDDLLRLLDMAPPNNPADAPQSFAPVTSAPPARPRNPVAQGSVAPLQSAFLGALDSLDAPGPLRPGGLNSGPPIPASSPATTGIPHVFYHRPPPHPYPYPHPHPPPPHGYLGASGVAQPQTAVIFNQLQPVYAQNMAYNYPGQVPAPDLAHAGLYKADSYSPEPGSDNATQSRNDNRPQHRRGYQACQRCRERKVKCDLGSVDAPSQPPCKRCLRERLTCEFAATRKKQKRSDGTARDTSKDPAEDQNDTSVAGSGMSGLGFGQGIQQSPSSASPSTAGNGFTAPSWTPQSSKRSFTSQPRELSGRGRTGSVIPQQSSQQKPSDVELHSQVAVATLGGQVSSTQDSIMLLVDAAYASEGATPALKDSPHSERGGRKRTLSSLDHGGPPAPTDTGFTPQEQAEQQAGLKAWSEMRFVRNGWFTAWEAMQYVEYFFTRLAPMTPIVFDEYRSPLKHQALLIDEPILALAILAIASRHMRLSGHAALSRSYQIHGKLWNNLRRQVERLLWGQEQFGGGFCGAGTTTKIRELETGQITWKGSLRTLGTLEALLLLTDWQPRALHFPPSDGEEGLLDRSVVMSSEMDGKPPGQNGEPMATRDYDNLPYASWLEPAWRADRMSWMLLGLAQSLAFELGVFDTNHFNCNHNHGPDSECARKRRIRNLILVYVAQTSGRMGVQCSLNVEEWERDSTWDQTTKYLEKHPIDVMQECWVHIARIMNQANRAIFSSHQFTRELISSGKYKDSIATFAPLLQGWKARFESVKAKIHPVMQSILIIEYEYARLYINSLGFQNVVESWIQGGSNIRKATLLKIAEDNKLYIDAVSDAALNILGEIVDGIAGQGFLRDAPVRTFLRSLSGIMFTLKRFSLGTHEALVRKCLQRLEKITVAMSQEVVDDVHLASSTSRLVQNIVRNVKHTLIRVQQTGTGSAGPSREQSRPQSPHGKEGNTDAQQQHASTQAINLNHLNTDFYMDDPLAEIQARPMAELTSQMFVPPPNFGGEGQLMDSALPDDSHLDPSMTLSMDWFALPLDNLFHNDEATVDQGFGGIGPTVGTRDMLEVITDRDYNQMQWNGNQTFGYGNI
ncbi:uncharacterized protein PV06_10613 [Exophiala oligosperma]|uniref:Zn(2)-C6 fungal-type domain-containing protein n=2 Tax=Chaetothyriales TaxID=34395 RepID=A0A0D2AA75_9EURO|nr:uncharacterized protein PV06_10613 [Exophiala oligosperma]KAJ9634485.1 zinc finger transcriptional activator [Knufia peltigerae]KIW37271.1 hypothetical protein PV06_10613 [Exophiala oligosperma]